MLSIFIQVIWFVCNQGSLSSPAVLCKASLGKTICCWLKIIDSPTQPSLKVIRIVLRFEILTTTVCTKHEVKLTIIERVLN